MKKWIYWVLLFLIFVGIGMFGVFTAYASDDLVSCHNLADFYRQSYSDYCSGDSGFLWFMFCVEVLFFVALIFLTKKGWKQT